MKNNQDRAILFFAIGAAVIAAVIRFFQYVSLIDFSTGFYNKGAEFAGALIYIVLAAAATAFIVLAVLKSKKGSSAFTLSSIGMGDHATQPLGASFILAAVLEGIKAAGSAIDISFFAQVIAAVILLAVGFLLLKNVEPPKITGHFQIAAALYFFWQTVTFFNSDLVVLKHSDNLIVLMGYILITAFFASSARFYARVETKNSRLREIITAGLTFLITMTYTLSKAAALILGGDAVKGIDGINLDMVSGAVLSLMFLVVIFFTKKTKEIEILPENN